MFGLRRLSLPLPVLTNECLTGSLPMLLGLPVDKRKCFHIQTSALTLECHRILTTSVTWRWLQKFNYMRWKKTWRWSILDFSLLETIVPYCEFLELPPTQRFMQNSVRFVCNIFRGKFFIRFPGMPAQLIFAAEYLPFQMQCICEHGCYHCFLWLNFEGHWAKHLYLRCGKDWLPDLLFGEINVFDNLCTAYRGHVSGSWIDQQPAKNES